MPQSVVKVFRIPSNAELALGQLKKAGFKGEEIVVISAKGKTAGDVASTLKSMDLSEEASAYYESALKLGGVLLSVRAEGGKATEALKIMRLADTSPEKVPMAAKSPGFLVANRMAATDPLDERMTGDFRRY